MALNLNKDGGEKKKFNLTKTPEVLPSKPEETIKNDTTESNPKKSNKGLWIVIGILVIVGGIWFVTSKSSEEIPNSAAETNQANISAASDSPSITAPISDTTTQPATATASNSATVDNSQKDALIPNTPAVLDNSNEQLKSEASLPNTTDNSGSKSVKSASAVAKSKDKTHTNFSAGSADLSNLSSELVKGILDFVAKNPSSKITINGYASSEGDLSVNQELSQKRAEKVRDYLIRKGVPATQLEAIGKGIENPIGDNNTLEGKMQNRRTEVVY